jgi:lipoprotein-anchoring transpeptidase ErfK/SrfK
MRRGQALLSAAVRTRRIGAVMAAVVAGVVLAVPTAQAVVPAAAPARADVAAPVNASGAQRATKVGPAVQVGSTLPPSIDPPVPANSGTGRRAVYSKSQQRVWIVEAGENVIRSYRVSGRTDIPAVGQYHVYLRQASTFATHNPTITWIKMVTFTTGPNGGGIGFHEIPWQFGHRVESEDQLGTPLSGGCVRQSVADAEFMWEWGQIGTQVNVIP